MASPLRAIPPWALGIALAIPLAVAYLIVSPPSGDLAAATYRSDLFARVGFTIWDNGWYAGHALPAYSLLAPALGAWLGVRVLLALSAIAAAAFFGLLAPRSLPPRSAQVATLAFAFGFCAELPSGRVPYDLGAAVALAALLAITAVPRSRRGMAVTATAALALSIATSAASPVAGAFLALAGVAIALGALAGSRLGASGHQPATDSAGAKRPAWTKRPAWRASVAAAAALATILVLAAAFPEGGFEPFAAGAFWPELAAAIAVALLLPRGSLSVEGRRVVRIGAGLYGLALLASFLVETPMGSNVVRLGAMFGAPILVGVLWEGIGVTVGGRRNVGRLVLLALSPLLLYWQLATAIDDQVALAGDPTVHASYYAPLRHELLKLASGAPIRVEVPLTNSHWESAYLPGGPISIARGWERQLDTRYDGLFYRNSLSPETYRRWLATNAIAYVALPSAKLDSAGEGERHLIDDGLPYLHEVWHSARWRLFAVIDATPLAQPPAQVLSVGADSFTLLAPQPGRYEVRLHWTPYWALSFGGSHGGLAPGRGCVSQAPDGFTEVRVSRPGKVRVGIDFSFDRIFSASPRCG